MKSRGYKDSRGQSNPFTRNHNKAIPEGLDLILFLKKCLYKEIPRKHPFVNV